MSRRRKVHGWALARDLAIATTSVLFSMWVAFIAGYQAVYQATLLLLIGIPIYAFLKARRERHGDVDEPVEATDTTDDESTTALHCFEADCGSSGPDFKSCQPDKNQIVSSGRLGELRTASVDDV